MNQKLIDYITRNLKSGYKKEAIMRALLKSGYDINTAQQHINYALNSINPDDDNKKINKTKEMHKPKTLLFILFGLVIAAAVLFGVFYHNAENKPVGAGAVDNEGVNALNDALIQHDESICEKIKDSSLKQQCKSSFFQYKDNNTCDGECGDKKSLNNALILHDKNLCNNISNQNLKEDCVNSFSRSRNAENSTENVCDEQCQDKNLLNSALIGRNSSVCSQINDSSIKKQCLQIFKKEVDEK